MRRAFLTLLLVLIGLAVPATASATTLYGSVNAARDIELKLDGADVTHLPAGIYTVIVTDSTSGHNFHLHGPGVDEATPVGNLSAVLETWIVTFTGGEYGFNCDRHPGSMYGSFTVGDVLEVTKTGSGAGVVSSLPSGIYCGGACVLPFAAPTPVTLTATPIGSSEFLGWSGSCSGVLGCTFTVTGFMSVGAQFRQLPQPPPVTTPPPPPATAPASVKSVTVARKNGVRTIRVKLSVARHTGGKVELRRKGAKIASKTFHLAAGSRLVQVRVPKSAKAGSYALRLTFTDSVTGKTFSSARTIRL